MKRQYLGLIGALLLFLLLVEIYQWRLTGQFSWPALITILEFVLIIFLWFRYPLLRKLIGEDNSTNRSHSRLILNFCLVVLLLVPFSIYLLTGELNKPVPPMAQFSIIAIAPILGGLVLTAASNFKSTPEKHSELICIAQKFISATVLFILFVPFIYMVNLLHGIDVNSFQWHDPIAWYRGIYFWLAVPCFYIGIVLFLFGIMDLLFVLVDLGTSSDGRQGTKPSTSEDSKPTLQTELSKVEPRTKGHHKARYPDSKKLRSNPPQNTNMQHPFT